jgi:hypothetical protein
LWNRKSKKEERKTVITTLKNNGYTHTVFNELLRKENRRKNGDEKRLMDYKNVVTIPYIAGLSEAIRSEGDNEGIKTVFAANDTLKRRLTHVKPKGDKPGKDSI